MEHHRPLNQQSGRQESREKTLRETENNTSHSGQYSDRQNTVTNDESINVDVGALQNSVQNRNIYPG